MDSFVEDGGGSRENGVESIDIELTFCKFFFFFFFGLVWFGFGRVQALFVCGRLVVYYLLRFYCTAV